MILSMSGQLWQFLAAIALGVLLGVGFDQFRVLRRLFRHPGLLIQLEDLVYWLLALGTFFLVFVYGRAGVRPFALLGSALGMLLYFLTASRLVIPGEVALFQFLGKVLQAIFRVIWFPIGLFLKLLTRIAVGLRKRIDKIREKRAKK